MALQLFVTTRQLCQSFAYQTTQLFQQCVVGSIGVKSLNNPLDELCGAFSNGTAYFKPFEYDVVAGASYGDLDGFTKEAKDYVEGLQTMFSQVRDSLVGLTPDDVLVLAPSASSLSSILNIGDGRQGMRHKSGLGQRHFSYQSALPLAHHSPGESSAVQWNGRVRPHR